jgi:hypothetical protein
MASWGGQGWSILVDSGNFGRRDFRIVSDFTGVNIWIKIYYLYQSHEGYKVNEIRHAKRLVALSISDGHASLSFVKIENPKR